MGEPETAAVVPDTPLSARLRAAQSDPPAAAPTVQTLVGQDPPSLSPMGSVTTASPASFTVPMPHPQLIVLVDPMSEEPNETNASRRFPPVSVTRFVPVLRSAESAPAASPSTPVPTAETFDPPPLAAPSPKTEEPLAEFLPAEPPADEPLATFTPVAPPNPAPPAAAPAPAPIPTPTAPKPALPLPEHGFASRLAPIVPPAPTPRAPEPPPAAKSESADVEQPPIAAGTMPGSAFLQPMQFGLAAPKIERNEAAADRSRVPAILVVDDNADYRFVVVREMRRMRPNMIRIEEADGAEAALNILAGLVRDNQRVFMLTDFRMPNQTGVDLVSAARRRHPGADIHYLVYSGINVRTAPELHTLSPDEFMEKPGDLIELRRQVARVLDRWLGPLPTVRTPT
jgi:CheY-like chemotaxis protein